MKVIDARTGREVKIGDTVDYGDGEYVRLIDIDEGLFSANAFVEMAYRDHSHDELVPTGKYARVAGDFIDGGPAYDVEFGMGHIRIKPGPIVTIKRQVPLQVRFTHPLFFLQKVAFIPS